jgi:hypothetical protein
MAKKKVLIEFTWRGKTISHFIEKDIIFDDINEKEDYWGEFVIGKDIYEYQIWWNSGEVAIFNAGAKDYCALVDNFLVHFSNRY